MKYILNKFNFKNCIKNDGFTLIELILYISLASIMFLTTSVFLSTIIESRVKNQTIAEVEQQGAQIMHIISQVIRNAESINSPSAGTSSSSLSLDVVNILNDPTIFNVSSGVIRITEGLSLPTPLMNPRVTASSVSFYNVSRPSTPGVVRISFTLSYINPDGRQEYNFARTFYGSASLRHP